MMNMSRTTGGAFQRDLPTRLQLLESGQLEVSELDVERRQEVMRRHNDVFSRLSFQERLNFLECGLPYRTGHLDGLPNSSRLLSC
jgi:hypothetical protein